MNQLPPQDTSYRLLVVDDNPAIHEDIRKVLAKDADKISLGLMEAELFGDTMESDNTEFGIDSAYQCGEAVELVKDAVHAAQPYALAFVDMRMPPGPDGMETIEMLWREDPEVQVVICTAYSDYSWAEINTRLQSTDQLLILKKPFDNVEILQLAHTLSRKWTLAREVRQQISDLDRLVEQRTKALEETNTELKRETTQLQKMEMELRLAQKLESIGQLAAGIAHEINTPTQYVGDNVRFLHDAFSDLLVVLRSFGDLLEAARSQSVTAELIEKVETTMENQDLAYLTDEVPKAIEQALAGVTRIAKIVRAMKEFAHPGGDEMEHLDVNKIIQNTITVARNEWKYVADVVTELDENLPALQGFPAELSQVFLNLIVNAAHAISGVQDDDSDVKGTITITSRQRGDAVEIRVRDTGPGVPGELRNRIFDPFFTTKSVGKGTGQGLAIARSVIVDKHGGSISLESDGNGATFVIQLPLEKEAERRIAAA